MLLPLVVLAAMAFASPLFPKLFPSLENIDIHLNSFYLTCKIFGEEMANRGSGSIVNFGSIYGLGGPDFSIYNDTPGMINGPEYAAIKGGISNLTRYLAAYWGKKGVRVNALSAGPMRTLAGAGISDARTLLHYQQRNAPMRRSPTLDEVGGSALYLLSDLSGAVTGEVHYVDCGYATTFMPTLDQLKTMEHAEELEEAVKKASSQEAAQ